MFSLASMLANLQLQLCFGIRDMTEAVEVLVTGLLGCSRLRSCELGLKHISSDTKVCSKYVFQTLRRHKVLRDLTVIAGEDVSLCLL